MNELFVQKRKAFLLNGLMVLLLVMGLSGCLTISDSYPPGPRYEAYQPIESLESQTFVSNALSLAESEFGAPTIPVQQVLLRRSIPLPEVRRYRLASNFSLTSCADSTNGLFVIYISLDPDHENYESMLAHECAHLLNPLILDWYMEGLAMVFSEEYCQSIGRPWDSWNRHFNRSRRDPYALSYRMMRELKMQFPEAYARIVQHTVAVEDAGSSYRIDIDAWLMTLSEDQREEALDIIAEYSDVLEKKVSAQYNFTVPQALN
jgi:hypothetical protein